VSKVHILKTGSTVEPLRKPRGDFEDWFRVGLGLGVDEAPVVAPYLGEALPDPATISALVVTGSPAMVTEEAGWSLGCEKWIAELVDRNTPVLGVCYGHQLLARALGGAAGENPNGMEIGTHEVELTDAGREDPLFAGLPSQLVVQQTHRQSVVELPDGARHLAGNDHDAFQAFAIGDRAWGLQFHPEFDANIMVGYARARAETLQAEGIDPHQVEAGVRDTDHGPAILRNFMGLI
jgi:GMP synthase (glutamine-hydrolysing)